MICYCHRTDSLKKKRRRYRLNLYAKMADMSSMIGMSGMSGMSGMGMDMSGSGFFQQTNKYIARVFWYIVVAVVALLLADRCLDYARTRYA